MNKPTGPDSYRAALRLIDEADHWMDADMGWKAQLSGEERIDRRTADLIKAQVLATNAQTAAIITLASAIESGLYELDGWRDVIPRPPLKECKGEEIRRPECAERHTDDCDYTDPVPEPKHELLPVGTRVLVSDPHRGSCGCGSAQPYVGKIAGYDMHSTKYQINEEVYGSPGEYYGFVRWAFVDNRVQVHPDGPEYQAPETT